MLTIETIGIILILGQASVLVTSEDTVLLKNELGNACLRVIDASQNDNANYTLAPCNSMDVYQQFRHSGIWKTEPGKESYIKNVGTDECLCGAAHNNINVNGFKIYQCDCTDYRNKRWVANGNGNYDPTGKNTFWIQGTNTGRLLSVRKDANVLVQWDGDDKTDPQNLWTVYQPEVVLLKNEVTGTCIKVIDGSNENNAKYVLAPCDPNDASQQMEHNGVWKIKAQDSSHLKVIASQKCLSGSGYGSGSGTEEGFAIYQYTCDDQYINQNFNLANGKYDSNGQKKFWIRVYGKKCLTVNGGDLVQGACKDTTQFYWRVYVAPPRSVSLKNLEFQRCMFVDGTKLVLRACLPPNVGEPKYFRTSSIWERDPKAPANLTLYTQASESDLCLSSADSNTVNNQDGYKIYIAPCKDDANYQQYRIGKGKYYPNGRDIFTIQSVPSGKCLAAKSKSDNVAQYTCEDNTNFYWRASPLPFSQKLTDRPDCLGPKSKKERCGPRVTDGSEFNKNLCAANYPECCWDDKVDFKDDADPACYTITE